MRYYIVYFEIYGKKMRSRVLAGSSTEAECKVRRELTVNKVTECSYSNSQQQKESDMLNNLKDIFGMS